MYGVPDGMEDGRQPVVRALQLALGARAAQGHFHGRFQGLFLERLEHKSVRLGQPRFFQGVFVRVCREVDDRNPRGIPDEGRRVDAAHCSPQADVHQDEVCLQGRRLRHRLLTGGYDRGDFVAEPLQAFLDCESYELFVFDNENPGAIHSERASLSPLPEGTIAGRHFQLRGNSMIHFVPASFSRRRLPRS